MVAAPLAAHIAFQFAPDEITLGMPEAGSLRLGLKVEQIHFLAQLAVIALCHFVEPKQMCGKLFLIEPAGIIDARQLRIALVAAPIGPRDPH